MKLNLDRLHRVIESSKPRRCGDTTEKIYRMVGEFQLYKNKGKVAWLLFLSSDVEYVCKMIFDIFKQNNIQAKRNKKFEITVGEEGVIIFLTSDEQLRGLNDYLIIDDRRIRETTTKVNRERKPTPQQPDYSFLINYMKEESK